MQTWTGTSWPPLKDASRWLTFRAHKKREAGLTGMGDPAVLAFAAGEGRVLVSHDRKTMPTHFADFTQHSTSPGLLIVSQHLPVSAAAEELLLIWVASEAEEWTNQIASLPI